MSLIGAALIGGVASLLGGSATNRANKRIADNANQLTWEQFQESLRFNAEQADISRQFSAHQASITRDYNSREARENRDFNAREAEKSRQWYTQMSNTAHQREVTDLKAAGLNPILSAYGGNGAPVSASPSASGSAAAAQAASSAMASASGGGSYHSPTMQNAVGDAVGSAMNLYTAGQNVKESESRILKQEAEITDILANAGLRGKQAERITFEIAKIKAEVANTHANTSGQIQKNQMQKILLDYYKTNDIAAIIGQMGFYNAAYTSGSNVVNRALDTVTNVYNTIDLGSIDHYLSTRIDSLSNTIKGWFSK